MDASVVICSHNPRPHYLSRALYALREQTLSMERWELILVDNASRAALSREFDLSWHPAGRHVAEPDLGLASARRLGIREARADLIVFVDDDNLLAPSYLEKALKIGAEWPRLGTWGAGQVLPEFEVAPAEHLRPYLPWLALRDNKSPKWGNVISHNESVPTGTGLCVRATVANAYLEFCELSKIEITGRRGESLSGFEDYEICYVGCNAGFGMGTFPELRLTHLIPKERLSDNYFLRLLESTHLSRLILDYKWGGNIPPSPFGSPRSMASLIWRLASTSGFERQVALAFLRGTQAARRVLIDESAKA